MIYDSGIYPQIWQYPPNQIDDVRMTYIIIEVHIMKLLISIAT